MGTQVPNETPSGSKSTLQLKPDAPSEFADPTNAALLYYQGWLSISDDLLRRAGSTSERDGGWRADQQTSNELASLKEYIDTLERAAEVPSADWGVEYSRGLNAMLPHLGKLRQTARMFGADARRLIDLGDSNAATGRVAAMFGMASHCTNDGTLISSLVSCSITTLACAEVDVLVTSGKLESNHRQALRAAIARVDPVADSFGVSKGIRGERTFFLGWLREQARGQASHGGAAVAQLLQQVSIDAEQKAVLARIEKLNEVGLRSEFEKAERYYDQLEQAWKSPDRAARVTDLEARVAEFGPISQAVTPSMKKVNPTVEKAREALAKARRQLVEPPTDK